MFLQIQDIFWENPLTGDDVLTSTKLWLSSQPKRNEMFSDIFWENPLTGEDVLRSAKLWPASPPARKKFFQIFLRESFDRWGWGRSAKGAHSQGRADCREKRKTSFSAEIILRWWFWSLSLLLILIMMVVTIKVAIKLRWNTQFCCVFLYNKHLAYAIS